MGRVTRLGVLAPFPIIIIIIIIIPRHHFLLFTIIATATVTINTINVINNFIIVVMMKPKVPLPENPDTPGDAAVENHPSRLLPRANPGCEEEQAEGREVQQVEEGERGGARTVARRLGKEVLKGLH